MPIVKKETYSVVLKKQERPGTRMESLEGGLQKDVTLVVKNQPFDCVVGLQHPSLRFPGNASVSLTLCYEPAAYGEDYLEVECNKESPFSFTTTSPSTTECVVSITMKMLSSKRSNALFALRLTVVDSAGNSVPGLEPVYTHPIRVVSKKAQLEPKEIGVKRKRKQPITHEVADSISSIKLEMMAMNKTLRHLVSLQADTKPLDTDPDGLLAACKRPRALESSSSNSCSSSTVSTVTAMPPAMTPSFATPFYENPNPNPNPALHHLRSLLKCSPDESRAAISQLATEETTHLAGLVDLISEALQEPQHPCGAIPNYLLADKHPFSFATSCDGPFLSLM
mmetsp:Transcript_2969/g.7245  ORF Transcript_2969/g.7245 Transcript_2969/m.7245 type:complete len:338 (+) Transcript_2969:216-1229(+)